MIGQSINSELKYLAELIEDFPPKKIIPAEEAFEKLKVRYEILESSIDDFLNTLVNIPESKLGDFLLETNKEEDYFPKGMKLFMVIAHTFLFKDILNNAGIFRLSTDSNYGKVYFGRLSYREIGKHQFSGSKPEKIEEDLEEAFKFLKRSNISPLKNGLEFYRRFVRIHPFYEANGRIARFILTTYLQYHGLYIVWREIDSKCKGKFISKLNSCHTHEGKATYEKYFGYFVDFIRPFVKPIAELKKMK